MTLHQELMIPGASVTRGVHAIMYGYTATPGYAAGTSTIVVIPVSGPETTLFVIERTMLAEGDTIYKGYMASDMVIYKYKFHQL